MPDDKKAIDCDPISLHDDKGGRAITKLAGEEGLKTAITACRAAEDGRFGYALLMDAKYMLHDIPVHQFSSGETPKPAATPVVKAPDSNAKGK
jgi:hypothetical protein